ncbi:MAG: PQQ-binding-like beta-propeller repeat protein, partial [Spirochaetia bacterium]|nr:PQQ-binding-like beta-propeller repeat protein [Spirochaetia bacterium]
VLDFFQLDRRRDAFLDVAKIRTLSLKDDASARKDLESVRLRHVGEPYFYAALVRRLLDAGEVNRAYEVSRDAVEYFPDDAESHFLLAAAHFENANFNRGADECRRAILLRPDHDATYALYARLLAGRHRYADSLKVVKKAREHCATTPESDLAEGDVCLAGGEPLRALEIYRSLLAKQPVRVALYHNAGLASLYAGKIRDAIFFFERASLFSEEAQVSRYYLAETRYRLGEYDEARSILEALLEKQPKEPYFLYALGRVYENFMLRGPASDFRRYWDLARSAYTRAMESSRFYTEPHLWAAERLRDLERDHFVKRLEQAEAKVRTALLSSDRSSFRILACFETGRVVNYDLATLKPIWSTTLETVPVQKPFRLGDDFFLAGETGYLTRIREADGKVKTKYRLPAPMCAQPLFNEPFLFIPTRGGAVEILQDDKSFGSLRFPGEIQTELAFQGTMVYAGCGNGELVAGDIYSRKIRWVEKMSDAPSGDLVLNDGKLFAGARDKQFYAVDAKTGREAFLYRNESPPTAFAVKSDDKVIFGTEGGLVRMLGGKGEFYWQYQAGGASGAPLSQGGLLLFFESPAGVVGLTYGEGKEIFRVSLDSRPVAPPVFIDRDLIAVLTENGYFYHIFLSRGWKRPGE